MSRRPAARTTLPAVAAAVVLGASVTTSAPAAAVTPPPPVTKLLTIVEENHSQAAALRDMPYLRSLSQRFGRTTNYHAVAHPSLPNYLALAGGSTFGVTDDRSPAYHHLRGPSVFDQVIEHGRTAKTYADGMPSHCYAGYSSAAPRYAVRHNPWTYFSDPTSRRNCGRYDVPLGTTSAGPLAADVTRGTLPTLGLMVPDTCHDGHDSGCTDDADAWLQLWIAKIQAGPDWKSGRLAVVITFDEDDGSSSNTVLTVVLAQRISSPIVTSGSFDHWSWTRWADEIGHAALLRRAAGSVSLRTPFGL